MNEQTSTLDRANDNLTTARMELDNAFMMATNTAQQRLNRVVMIATKAENVAHVAKLVRLHLKQTADGCILDS